MSKILVIDDNALISNMLKEGLTEHGYDVRVAMDANQGFNLAVSYRPDLIILDVQLPDVTGFDLCRIIKGKAELRQVPIIVVSGTACSTEEKVKGFQMGIDDYVLKPFEMPELLERVAAILRRTEGRRTEKVSTPYLVVDRPAPVELPQPSERLSVLETMIKAVISPSQISAKPFVPGISLAFILIGMGLSLSALALSAGNTFSLALAGLYFLGIWGISLSAFVMGSSIVGIPMKWKEGAGLVSLAATPLLLKFAGALATSIWTTLSPFYYSAGLALIWEGAPPALARIDVFELWAAYLLWRLVLGQAKRRNVALRLAWSNDVK